VLTHNHPARWNFALTDPRHVDNSFFIDDIRTACRGNLREIRAITPRYRYVMRRPAAGWDKNYFDKIIEPAYIKYGNEAMQELKDKVKKGVMTL